MSNNRYKFRFGQKPLTLTTDKDNLFMEEVERLAKEKYEAIKEHLPQADDETVAILMAINCLSTQLVREQEFDKERQEWEKWVAGEVSGKNKAKPKGGKA
ncbi:cell division protein ZapA [Streptococcus cuniculipharyngis]|uniref:Cell division protein ZapA n=1 Tax=Streptococcus cuniculipharyngis TaxID=1562651 RepID=A0A5C5SCB2_9STRE|nr:cell division protein ZapA [Streptococcus cuniculipharyngis]TWS98199.1 hypothetical protein FRX57_04515 [Streptococcus cuniculipharyngis]